MFINKTTCINKVFTMKVKVTLMSAVEPEIRRATLENNPDFVNFKKTALELFGEIGTEFLFLWKGKNLRFFQFFF